MACPHVAGVAALLMSIFDTASSQMVRDALEKSALGLAQCGRNAKFGYGHVDAKAAADLIQSGGTPASVTCNSAVVTITTDSYGSETTWQISNSQGVPIAGGGPYGDGNRADEVTTLDLPELPSGECYQFTIFDSRDDGYVGILFLRIATLFIV
jgi:subtilisin family serine protease